MKKCIPLLMFFVLTASHAIGTESQEEHPIVEKNRTKVQSPEPLEEVQIEPKIEQKKKRGRGRPKKDKKTEIDENKNIQVVSLNKNNAQDNSIVAEDLKTALASPTPSEEGFFQRWGKNILPNWAHNAIDKISGISEEAKNKLLAKWNSFSPETKAAIKKGAVILSAIGGATVIYLMNKKNIDSGISNIRNFDVPEYFGEKAGQWMKNKTDKFFEPLTSTRLFQMLTPENAPSISNLMKFLAKHATKMVTRRAARGVLKKIGQYMGKKIAPDDWKGEGEFAGQYALPYAIGALAPGLTGGRTGLRNQAGEAAGGQIGKYIGMMYGTEGLGELIGEELAGALADHDPYAGGPFSQDGGGGGGSSW